MSLEDYKNTADDMRCQAELLMMKLQFHELEAAAPPVAAVAAWDELTYPIFDDPLGRKQKYRIRRICGHIHFTIGSPRNHHPDEDLSTIAGPLSACAVCHERPSLVVAWEEVGEPSVDLEGGDGGTGRS